MKKNNYIIWLGIAAAAGTALGMLSDRREPAKGGLMGATAGIVAGSVAAVVYRRVTAEQIPFYSSVSSLYEDIESA